MTIKYYIPATNEQGSNTIVGKSSMMETAHQNALWEYNDMREKDGQEPVTDFPFGTIEETLNH